MPGKKLLMLSASAGHGHVRASDALAAAAGVWFPGTEARHVDLMSIVPRAFALTYAKGYIRLVQSFPRIWGYMYVKTDADRPSWSDRLRRAVESAANKKLLPLLADYAPDHIICTHFMPMQFLARWRAEGRLSTPVWGCVTDFVAHRYWLEPGLNGYFTASEENVGRMKARGLAKENVQALGIPVMPEFIPPTGSEATAKARAEACATFGLDPARPVVPLMGGGAGVGHPLELVPKLFALPADFQLVVLAGKNKKLLRDLQNLAARYPGRLFPMGFTNEVPALLAAADFVITKPGGLTTAECLAMGKPMLVYGPIPGQEELNTDFLLENGAALKAPDSFGLVWRAGKLLEDRELLARLSANAAALGKPYAARDILATVLGEAPR